jgi:uncharacterized membrane protein YphA (DoxX/SURF4 family)
VTSVEADRRAFSPVDAVAGLLAVGSVALSAVAMHAGFFLGLDARPARTAAVAMVLAIVAGRMSTRFESTARKAMFLTGLAWIVGMTIAVLTEAPLF